MESEMTLEELRSHYRPSDVLQGNTSWCLTIGAFELEMVARDVVITLAEFGNKWRSFTFKEYQEAAQSGTWAVSDHCLLGLVRGGYLSRGADLSFSIEERFARTCGEIIRRRDAEARRNHEDVRERVG